MNHTTLCSNLFDFKYRSSSTQFSNKWWKSDEATYWWLKNVSLAYKDRKFVIYIGSGITENCKLPGWDELIKKLYEDEDIQFIKQNKDTYKKGRNLKIAKYAVNQLGQFQFEARLDAIQSIEELLHDADLTLGTKLTQYLTPQNLPCETLNTHFQNMIGIQHLLSAIITTNYNPFMKGMYLDTFDDTNSIQEWKKHIFSCNKSLVSKLYTSKGNKTKLNYAHINTPVIQIHGSVDNANSIVFGTKHYEALQENKEYMSFMATIMCDTPVLYIGSSLGDEYLLNIRKQMHEKGMRLAPHYAILKSKDAIKKECVANKCGITIIRVDDDHWDECVDSIFKIMVDDSTEKENLERQF